MTFKEGMRYEFLGDTCDCGGVGIIKNIYRDRWGAFIDGLLDDGRFQERVPVKMFNDGKIKKYKLI